MFLIDNEDRRTDDNRRDRLIIIRVPMSLGIARYTDVYATLEDDHDSFPNKGEFIDDALLRREKKKEMKVNSRFEGRNLFKKKNKKGGFK